VGMRCTCAQGIEFAGSSNQWPLCHAERVIRLEKFGFAFLFFTSSFCWPPSCENKKQNAKGETYEQAKICPAWDFTSWLCCARNRRLQRAYRQPDRNQRATIESGQSKRPPRSSGTRRAARGSAKKSRAREVVTKLARSVDSFARVLFDSARVESVAPCGISLLP